jgi:PKD repeat protein
VLNTLSIMKKLSLLTAIALFAGGSLFAQDWTEMMKTSHPNLKDVQNAFYSWYNQNKSNAKEEQENKNPQAVNQEEDGNYELFKRWEWQMKIRTGPSGIMPDKAAVALNYQNFLAQQASNNTARVLSSPLWSYIGPTSPPPGGGGAGRVNHLRFNPSNSSILYACTPSGGLWTSINGGSSWTTKTDHLYDLSCNDVAIDPTNTNVMYLATGDGDGIGGGFTTPSTAGILKSTDGGNTWNATNFNYTYSLSGPASMTVNEVMISPMDHNFIFAATSFGLYYSPDAGLTWNFILSGDFKDMAFEPFHPLKMYITTAGSPAAFYRSTDGGLSFTKITLPNATTAQRMALAVTPADSNRVYVLADDASTNDDFLGLWMSTNQGQTFTRQSHTPNLLGFSLTGGDNQGQGWYTLSLAASPTNAGTVVVGGVNIWMSNNSGVSWNLNADQVGVGAPYVHADIHQLTYLPGSGSTFFAACDGGVFKTTNSGPNFGDISHNLEIAQQYCVGLSSNNANLWLSGWQDNGTNLLNGASWVESLYGDGMVCFIDNTNNNNMYGETFNGGFHYSPNGGASYTNIAINTSELGAWVTPWQQDPAAPNTLYGGYENVWKSTNQGNVWNPISTWGVSGNSIVTLKVAPSNNQYIYAANLSTLYVTTNGGTSWTNINGTLPIGFNTLTGIAIDNANPSRVWVTFSGFSIGSKAYESDNAGTTWTDISTGLPPMPANCIVYQGSGIDAMYVGTDVGVYYRDTTTTMKNWVSYNNGLPNVEIADLKIYAPGNLLRAGTYGRGTWQIGLYNAPAVAPAANFSAYPLTICANTQVQFTDSSANQPTSWSWTFTGGTPATSTVQNPTVLYGTAGTYQVVLTATNANGNTTITKTNYIKVNPLPSPAPACQQTGDLLKCVPATYTYYQWFRSNVLIPYDTTSQFWMWQTGLFKVVVSNQFGCSISSPSINVSVLGINEVSYNDEVAVYPNPATGSVNVSFNLPQEGNYVVELTNVLGQTVYTEKLQLNGPFTKTIDVSNFSKGIYMLSLNGQNTKIVKKIVVY